MRTVRALLLLVTGVFIGCSSGPNANDPDAATKKSDIVEVSGTVTMDGQPLANATVRFEPAQGTTGTTSWGITDSTGYYKLRKANGLEGSHAGRFKVVIAKFARADGSPFPPDVDGATAAAEGKEHLPPKYSDADRTELSAEVPKEGKKIDFALKSK